MYKDKIKQNNSKITRGKNEYYPTPRKLVMIINISLKYHTSVSHILSK